MSKKDLQLGMSHGTANNRLNRMLLFSMVQKLGLDVCFRCGRKIESINELSIEHKVAWLNSNNPKELFFDLDNVTFSHLSCNASFASHPKRKTDEEKNETRKINAKKEWQKRKDDPNYKEYQRNWNKNRYNSDPEFRKMKLDNRSRYKR